MEALVSKKIAQLTIEIGNELHVTKILFSCLSFFYRFTSISRSLSLSDSLMVSQTASPVSQTLNKYLETFTRSFLERIFVLIFMLLLYRLGLAEIGQNGQISQVPGQLYSYVKMNSKAGLFSSTF